MQTYIRMYTYEHIYKFCFRVCVATYAQSAYTNTAEIIAIKHEHVACAYAHATYMCAYGKKPKDIAHIACIGVCICIYSCVYLCIHMCMHACKCMYVCMYVFIFIYMYVCVYLCTHVRVYACIYMCLYVWT